MEAEKVRRKRCQEPNSVLPGPAAGAERGFAAEVANGAAGPGLVAEGHAAGDAAADGCQLVLRLGLVDVLDPARLPRQRPGGQEPAVLCVTS